MDRDERLREARLYGIVDLGYVAEADCEDAARALLAGGVDVLQLRAKNYGKDRILEIAKGLVPLCRGKEVLLIVNDHVEVAQEAGADGVHLGQDDGSLAEAGAKLPGGAILGRSTHSPAQAFAAVEEGADYIGFGPLFATPTKRGRPGIGLHDIAQVEEEVGANLPVFCIGGIKLDNLSEVLAAGARRIVMVSGLLQAENITARCLEVRELLEI